MLSSSHLALLTSESIYYETLSVFASKFFTIIQFFIKFKYLYKIVQFKNTHNFFKKSTY